MNKVATTRLEIDYESEPYGKPLLRGVVDNDCVKIEDLKTFIRQEDED